MNVDALHALPHFPSKRDLWLYQGSKRGVLVSPADEAGFLHELVARSSHLALVGDRIERRQR